MNRLSVLFHQRIGYAGDEKVDFARLDRILELAAQRIPFENLCIAENRTEPVSKENLMRKILLRGEGGLCYELNPLLYFYLAEQGYDVKLVRGVVFHADSGRFVSTGRTHVAILLVHEGQPYLVDTGFGGNLPLKPVPLTGETVRSMNGLFRAVRRTTGHGDYVFEMKLAHKDEDWRIGYAFDSRVIVTDLAELEEVRSIIEHHPDSSFNKHRLITRLTDRGSVTLTDSSLTRWTDGVMTKETIDASLFEQYVGKYFARKP